MYLSQDDFSNLPINDCDQINELRSTSECQRIGSALPFAHPFDIDQNFLKRNVDDDDAMFQIEDPGSISEIINHIQEPDYIEPELQIRPQAIIDSEVQAEQKFIMEKKHKKNSNAIKKIGRIILNFIQNFKLQSRENDGVKAMMEMLNKKAKKEENPKDFRDRFNVSHLEALFSNCPPEVSSFNLRVAKRLFNKQLRKEILTSYQIKGHNKAIYLNTLKCSGLRFCNKKLALRLQLSEILD